MKIQTDKGIAERLRRLRQELHLTQQEMASKIGIHHQTYKNYESANRQLTIPVLLKIIETFKILPDALFRQGGPFFMEEFRTIIERTSLELRKTLVESEISLSPEKENQLLAELVVSNFQCGLAPDAKALIRLISTT